MKRATTAMIITSGVWCQCRYERKSSAERDFVYTTPGSGLVLSWWWCVKWVAYASRPYPFFKAVHYWAPPSERVPFFVPHSLWRSPQRLTLRATICSLVVTVCIIRTTSNTFETCEMYLIAIGGSCESTQVAKRLNGEPNLMDVKVAEFLKQTCCAISG